MKHIVIETDRLYLREFQQEDINDLAMILQDERVMTAYEKHFSHQDVQDWLDRQLERYQRDGFGLWVAEEKESGKVVGQIGLTLQPVKEDIVLEVGYLLKYDAWHNGYAREGALACKRYAFDILHAKKLHAIIKTDNMASIQVARFLGMKHEATFEKEYAVGSRTHYLFAVHC